MVAIINGLLACAVLVAAAGCSIAGASWARVIATQSADLSGPLSAGSTLTADTHNGAVVVNGIDSSTCMVKATVQARALTEARAKELAAATKVSLVPAGNGLNVEIDQPRTSGSESISVGLDISAPKAARLDLSSYNGRVEVAGVCAGAKVRSHNGNVELTAVTGDVDVATYNGHTECTDINGNITAESHNGPVKLDKVAGNVSADSYNGSVTIAYAESASPAPAVTLTSHNGNISLTAPKGFSATAEMSTHNGKVRCGTPFLMESRNAGEMKGRFGDGKGTLKVRTYNGDVEID